MSLDTFLGNQKPHWILLWHEDDQRYTPSEEVPEKMDTTDKKEETNDF